MSEGESKNQDWQSLLALATRLNAESALLVNAVSDLVKRLKAVEADNAVLRADRLSFDELGDLSGRCGLIAVKLGYTGAWRVYSPPMIDDFQWWLRCSLSMELDGERHGIVFRFAREDTQFAIRVIARSFAGAIQGERSGFKRITPGTAWLGEPVTIRQEPGRVETTYRGGDYVRHPAEPDRDLAAGSGGPDPGSHLADTDRIGEDKHI